MKTLKLNILFRIVQSLNFSAYFLDVAMNYMCCWVILFFFQGFVLQHQVILFCIGETFTDQPPIYPSIDLPVYNRANAADFGGPPKPGVEVNLGLFSLLGTLFWHYAKCNVFSSKFVMNNCLPCYSCSWCSSLSNSIWEGQRTPLLLFSHIYWNFWVDSSSRRITSQARTWNCPCHGSFGGIWCMYHVGLENLCSFTLLSSLDEVIHSLWIVLHQKKIFAAGVMHLITTSLVLLSFSQE